MVCHHFHDVTWSGTLAWSERQLSCKHKYYFTVSSQQGLSKGREEIQRSNVVLRSPNERLFLYLTLTTSSQLLLGSWLSCARFEHHINLSCGFSGFSLMEFENVAVLWFMAECYVSIQLLWLSQWTVVRTKRDVSLMFKNHIHKEPHSKISLCPLHLRVCPIEHIGCMCTEH